MPNTGLDPAAARQAVESKLEGMSFLAHLEELRMRIIKCVGFVAAGFALCWWKAEWIFSLMQRPIVKALAANGMDTKLVYTNPTEPFNIYIKVGLVTGLFLASPLVLYQVWQFIAPGLYRHEKKWVVPFMFFTVLLFISGGLFGYFIVYPNALNFLIQQGRQFLPMITIGEYMDLFLVIIVGLGIIFELPILVFFLSLMGIVSASWMWKNLRYSILVIFIVAAIITPTTDLMNMMIFSAPMIVLYLFSIGIAWLVHPRRRKAKAIGS